MSAHTRCNAAVFEHDTGVGMQGLQEEFKCTMYVQHSVLDCTSLYDTQLYHLGLTAVGHEIA